MIELSTNFLYLSLVISKLLSKHLPDLLILLSDLLLPDLPVLECLSLVIGPGVGVGLHPVLLLELSTTKRKTRTNGH